MKKYLVKNTRRYGKGVFASTAIKKGELVCNMLGKKMDVTLFVDKVLEGDEQIDYALQVGRRTYLQLKRPYRFFNHSCDPNCSIRNRNELFALRNIEKGEELTFDYSMTVGPTDWKMKCLCGSNKCRKTLGDVLSVSKKRRDEYRRLGGIQRFMRNLLKEIEIGNYTIPKYEKLALQKLGDKRYDA